MGDIIPYSAPYCYVLSFAAVSRRLRHYKALFLVVFLYIIGPRKKPGKKRKKPRPNPGTVIQIRGLGTKFAIPRKYSRMWKLPIFRWYLANVRLILSNFGFFFADAQLYREVVGHKLSRRYHSAEYSCLPPHRSGFDSPVESAIGSLIHPLFMAW